VVADRAADAAAQGSDDGVVLGRVDDRLGVVTPRVRHHQGSCIAIGRALARAPGTAGVVGVVGGGDEAVGDELGGALDDDGGGALEDGGALDEGGGALDDDDEDGGGALGDGRRVGRVGCGVNVGTGAWSACLAGTLAGSGNFSTGWPSRSRFMIAAHVAVGYPAPK
jgi:hypothetical protein